VGPGHFLFHRRQEPLRIEKPGHPEHGGFSFERPRRDLFETQRQFDEPKPYGRRRPGYFQPVRGNTAVVQEIQRVGQCLRTNERTNKRFSSMSNNSSPPDVLYPRVGRGGVTSFIMIIPSIANKRSSNVFFTNSRTT